MHIAAQQAGVVGLAGREAPEHAAVGAGVFGVAVDQADLRVLLEEGDGFGDGARQQAVISVEPEVIGAAGASEAFVERISLAGIRLGDPVGQARRLGANQITKPWGRRWG